MRRVAALWGLTLAPPVALAAPPRRVELQRSPLAGFQYHAGTALWPQLAVGDALDLVRESDNRHDARAVRVDWRGNKLGYLPRAENAAVRHLLDGGERVDAAIAALRESPNPWQRVELALWLDLASATPGEDTP
jgi:hypothetical protein